MSVGFFASALGGASLLLAIPTQLWRLYVDHLCDVRHGSWVSKAASTFQFLACLVIAPFALLSLLDVMSYIIARTLGVVETTKASTSDKRVPDVYGDSDSSVEESLSETELVNGEQPPVYVTPASVGNGLAGQVQVPGFIAAPSPLSAPASGGLRSRLDARMHITMPDAPSPQALLAPLPGSGPAACFFSPSDERSLELSGANLSSPTVSRQGSPALERRRLQPLPGDALLESDVGLDLAREPEPGAANSIAGLRRRGAVLSENDASVSRA